MYSENEDFEEDYKESNSGSFGDKLKDFYENNKKLVLIIGGILLFLLILSMFKSCSSNPQGGNIKPDDITIVLTEEEKFLSLGTSTKLVANAIPETLDYRSAEYEWSSSNEEIATVDNFGNVNGLKIGTALITVTMLYNDKTYTDICQINVIEGEENVLVTDVSFPDGELLITVGDKYQIKKVVTPSNGFIEKIVFTSSNTSVVDVDDNGVIKALSEGITTIKMSVNDDKFTDELVVNVVSENIEPQMIFNPTNIVFDSPKLNLVEGNIAELTYQTLPSNAYRKNLKWSSSDITIATVDSNGVVTAKKAGTAVITLSASDEVKAEIVVEVESAVVNVTSVSIITGTNLNLNIGDTSTIVPNVLPENATDKSVSYSSSDSNIAMVDNNGVVTAISAGTAVITVTTNEGLKTATVTVTVNGNSSSGGSSSGSGSSSGGGSSSSKPTTSSDYNFGYNFYYNDVYSVDYHGVTNKYIHMNLRITNKSTSSKNAIYFCVNESSSTAKSATGAKKLYGKSLSSNKNAYFYGQNSNTCNKATGLNSGYWDVYVPCGASVCVHVEVDNVKYKEKCLSRPSCP